VTGERFGADTALRIGLVDEVAEDPDAAVDRVLGELATSGPQAAREAKRLVREGPRGEATTQVAARLRTSTEGQEGLRAFLERREASWRSASSS
jgi:methylglutaconyl-CoA hydratase